MIKKVINAGWTEDMPKYLKKRVLPTNIIALTVAIVIGIPFTIITYIYFPSLVLLPLSGGVLCGGILLINHLGGIRYSRVLLSLVPISLGAAYNAFLSGPNDDPLPSLYLIELSFALIPFIVFDIKERGFMIFSVLISTTIILTFPITRDWVHADYDSTLLRSGWIASLTSLLAILGEFSFVMGVLIISHGSEKETEQSRREAEEQNSRLLAQQEDNVRKTQALEEAQTEEKKRQWISDGLSLISEVVRRVENQESVFDKLILTTVKYLEANQGGLFVIDRDEENTQIRLAACYAYERKKYIEKTIAPGEGLIGQAFLEKEPTYLTDIPADYVRITSGLGKANPSALLIMPMKVNDVVEGILEVASFREFAEHEIEFLDKAGEIIASHVQTQRMMQETQQLLVQAKEQSEELQATEEEMRQNMEEMQATQESADRSQRRVQAIFDSATDGIVLLTDRGHVEMFNPAAEHIFGYRAEEMEGQSFEKLFVPPSDSSDGVLTSLLTVGQQQMVEARRKNGQLFSAELRVQESQVGSQRVFVGSIRDLTQDERTKANEELMQERIRKIEKQAYERLSKLREKYKGQLAERDQQIEALQAGPTSGPSEISN